MSIIDEAIYLRSVIEQLSVNLDDEQAVEAVELFPAFGVLPIIRKDGRNSCRSDKQ